MAKELKVAELYSELKLDTKGFTAALTRSKTNLANFQKDVSKTNNSLKKTITTLTKSIDEMANSLAKATGTSNISKLNTEMAKTKTIIDGLAKVSAKKVGKAGVQLAMEQVKLAAIDAEVAVGRVGKAARSKVDISTTGKELVKSPIQDILDTRKARRADVQEQLNSFDLIGKTAKSTAMEVRRANESIQSTALTPNLKREPSPRKKQIGGSKRTPTGGEQGPIIDVEWSPVTDSVKNVSESTSKVAKGWKDVANNIKGSLPDLNNLSVKQDTVTKQLGEMQRGWLNVKNIVQGIIISQTLYTGLSAVQGWVSSTLQMSQEIESAQASFNTLLQDADKAKELVQYVQDFASNSTFTFESATDATKQMLAYGFELENVGALLNVVGDASAAMGNQEAFGSIVKALGQIKTKGKVATQEILQLTEAGVPAFEILEEKLGLTKEQLGNLGNEGISAGAALEALSEGLTDRYSGAMAAMSQTTEGLKNNISETATFIGTTALKPMTDGWRNVLQDMSSTLTEWLSIVRTSGIGGLFEHVVPPHLQENIRLLVANVVQFASSVRDAHIAFKPFTQEMWGLAATMGNLLLPILTTVNNAIAWVGNSAQLSTTPVLIFRGALAGLAIFGTIALLAKTATKAIAGFSAIGQIVAPLVSAIRASTMFATAWTAVKGVLAGPLGIPIAMAGITTLVAGLAVAGKAVSNMTANMGASVGALGSDYLQPVYEEAKDTTNMYNESIEESVTSTNELGDATKKAGEKAKKAAQGLQSFDEVFNLPETPDETGGVPDMGGGGIPDIGGPSIGAPTMPDFGQFAKDYTDNFDAAMKVGFKPKRWWTTMWEEMKLGFSIGVERLGGILGLIGDSFSAVFDICGGIVKTAIAIWNKEWSTIPDIWREVGAKIKSRWSKTWSDLKGETSKGLAIIQKSTRNDMQGVIETFETALKLLPNITDDNIGEAAKTFTSHLRFLDKDAITVLRGTSDSMANLFYKIRDDMSEDEANKQFAENIKRMKDAGLLDVNLLEKDFNAAMRKIKDGVIYESVQMQTNANRIIGVMRDNSTSSAREMSKDILKSMEGMKGDTVNELKGMGGQWAQLFDGITSDSDLESKETRRLVAANIKKMKEDGTFNINQLQIDSDAMFKKMAHDADIRTAELARAVNNGTWDASVFAGVNAGLINENINRVLDDLPDQSEEHIRHSKEKMVNQLIDAGYLTGEQGKSIVNGLVGELGEVPGESNTIFGVKLKAAIKETIPTVLDAIFQYGKDMVKDFFKAIGNGFVGFGSFLVTNFTEGWSTLVTDAKALVKKWNPLGDFSMSWKNISDFADSMWAGFKSGWDSFKGWVSNTINKWNPFKGKSFEVNLPKPGDVNFVGPVKGRSQVMNIPTGARGGILNRTAATQLGSSSFRRSSTYNQDDLSMLGNTISGSVSSAMAGGMQMQTQMLRNVGSIGSASKSQQQTNMVVFAMDDNNVRTLLRRLRIEAEREKTRTFGSIGGIM